MVVIGGGPAGLVTAAAAAGLGAKVALIEKHLLGGDCLNVGCVPSKCVIRSSRASAAVREAERFGVHRNGGPEVDFAAVMERMRDIRAGIAHIDSAKRFQEELGVDVFLGEARFTGEDTVAVGEHTIRFRRACIATGARAQGLPIEGLDDAGYLTNETIFTLTERPARLAVLGSGPIGSELAQAFQNLGSQVTLIETADRILGRDDSDAAAVVAAQMEQDGVRILLGAQTRRVSSEGVEKVLQVDVGGGEERIPTDAILVAAGRKPNVEGMDLEKASVEYDARSGVTVDDFLRTSNPRIFAAGDVCMAAKFTHAADFAARIVIQNALFSVIGLGRKRLSSLVIPWCTYTHPELGHVGMHPHEAEAKGLAVETFTQPLADVDRALADGDTEGFVRMHVEQGTDRILGATIVARNAGDLISEVTLAMTNGLGLGKISGTIHPYPTQADAIRKTGDLYNKTKLTPSVKRWLERWMAFRL
jgi:pyruvate/2-oxoglutarate dehydrogenase complex dihydrolipoamide dehydrogenase (E3) component